jgi:hypothetical protein
MSSRSIVLDDRDLVLTCAGTREAVRAAVTRLYEHAKERIATAPDKVDSETGELEPRVWRFVFGEDQDDRSLKQNRFYFGVVLKQISEQARVASQRYTAEAWHELGKRQFLGYEVIKVPVAGRKRVQVYRRLRSTTDLTVKQMSEYLDEFIAFAEADLSVVFEFNQQEREAVRYKRPARKQRHPAEATA